MYFAFGDLNGEVLARRVAFQRLGIALVMVSISQPWGEYLVEHPEAIPPAELARQAFRAGLGISALGLEIPFDARTGTTPPRDELAVLNLIDAWSQFNVPLVIFLYSGMGTIAADRRGNTIPPEEAVQMDAALERFVPLLSIHPRIMALGWAPWRDTSADQEGRLGLWNAATGPTPRLPPWRTNPLRKKMT